MKTTSDIFNMTTVEIVERYPFIAFYNDDEQECEFNYSTVSTWLDGIPIGWLIAFGKMMCEEIRRVAIETNCLDTMRTLDIKEKFGELRWYVCGESSEVADVIDKYAVLSSGVCMTCGKPDVRRTRGWIAPICFDCWSKVRLNTVNQKAYLEATNDAQMPNEMKWRSYDPVNKKWVDHKTDITKTADKIRYNWIRRRAFGEA